MKKEASQFQKTVLAYYGLHKRQALPWRTTKDPYRILVSEVMLQQTQVERVIPYYKQWIKEFPTAKSLARAPLHMVLPVWQGLGYNRRAKMLHETAKVIATHTQFPNTPEALEALPGIGPYTARAVCAFAFNQDVVFVETNIRTAVTHHFFPKRKKIADSEIVSILDKVLPKGRAREWYSALMDYGTHLKRTGIRINSKAKGYTKQPAFHGSLREARGAILRVLIEKPRSRASLVKLLGTNREDQMRQALQGLIKEGMVTVSRGSVHLPA